MDPCLLVEYAQCTTSIDVWKFLVALNMRGCTEEELTKIAYQIAIICVSWVLPIPCEVSGVGRALI